jgi:hypothetical protein
MNHFLDLLRVKWHSPAWRHSTFVTLLAAVSAALAVPHMWTVEPEVLPDAVLSATERVGEIPVEVATTTAATTPGRHMGFDTNVYPGDKAMQAWKESAGYEWVGYYLPAPCHKDNSWAGKRERLVEMGWGMAVIYVGQQTWGRTPRPTSKAAQRAGRSGASCNADFVSAGRGTIDGDDAVAKAAADGFPRGTVIFLDVERMETMPAAMRDYYKAWAARVLADGRYRPGVYVHAHNATDVHDDLKQVFAAASNAEEPTVWVASGHNFSRDKAPTDVGKTFADVWQGMLDIVESNGGVKLPIDVNVAAVPSPSDQYAITAD